MCFFFNDTATTEIYTLSLHDALLIYLLLALFVRVRSHRTSVWTFNQAATRFTEINELMARLGPPDEHEAVADGQKDVAYPRIGLDMLIECSDGVVAQIGRAHV